jgi:hypothetical protein
MPFIIRCVKCQRKLRVLDRLAGKLVKCPACQTKFVAQAAASAAVAAAPAMARPAGQSPSGSRTTPKPPPSSKVPLSRPAPSAPPSSKVPAGSRSRVGPATPPPEEAVVDHGEDEFMSGSASAKLPPRPLDDLPPTAPGVSKSAVRRQRQTPFVNVFAVLGGVLLVTAILGLAAAYWVNSRVQYLQGSPAAGKKL